MTKKNKALRLEMEKTVQPFMELMNAKVQEKAHIMQQIKELSARSRQLGAEYETAVQQKRKITLGYEERKLALQQQFNREWAPPARPTADVQFMHHVRCCVLACLKNALAGRCNTDDIRFNFHFNEDGTLTLDCNIPDIEK